MMDSTDRRCRASHHLGKAGHALQHRADGQPRSWNL